MKTLATASRRERWLFRLQTPDVGVDPLSLGRRPEKATSQLLNGEISRSQPPLASRRINNLNMLVSTYPVIHDCRGAAIAGHDIAIIVSNASGTWSAGWTTP